MPRLWYVFGADVHVGYTPVHNANACGGGLFLKKSRSLRPKVAKELYMAYAWGFPGAGAGEGQISPVVGRRKMYLYMCQGMNKVKASKEEKYFRPEARPKAPPQARVPFSLREPPWA